MYKFAPTLFLAASATLPESQVHQLLCPEVPCAEGDVCPRSWCSDEDIHSVIDLRLKTPAQVFGDIHNDEYNPFVLRDGAATRLPSFWSERENSANVSGDENGVVDADLNVDMIIIQDASMLMLPWIATNLIHIRNYLQKLQTQYPKIRFMLLKTQNKPISWISLINTASCMDVEVTWTTNIDSVMAQYSLLAMIPSFSSSRWTSSLHAIDQALSLFGGTMTPPVTGGKRMISVFTDSPPRFAEDGGNYGELPDYNVALGNEYNCRNSYYPSAKEVIKRIEMYETDVNVILTDSLYSKAGASWSWFVNQWGFTNEFLTHADNHFTDAALSSVNKVMVSEWEAVSSWVDANGPVMPSQTTTLAASETAENSTESPQSTVLPTEEAVSTVAVLTTGALIDTTVEALDTTAVVETTAGDVDTTAVVETTAEAVHTTAVVETTAEAVHTTAVVETTVGAVDTTAVVETTAEAVDTTAVVETTVDSSETSDVVETTVEAVDTTDVVETTVEAVDTTAVVETTVELVDTTAVVETTVELVDTTAVVETTVEAVDTTAVVETTVEAVDTTAVVETTVEAVDTTAVGETTVEAIDTTVVVENTVDSSETSDVVETTTEAVDTTAVVETTVEAIDTTVVVETTVEAIDTTVVVETTVEAVETTAVVETTIDGFSTTSGTTDPECECAHGSGPCDPCDPEIVIELLHRPEEMQLIIRNAI